MVGFKKLINSLLQNNNMPKLKTYVQIITICVYSLISFFLLINVITAYQSGQITFLECAEKIFWIIVFLVAFVLGSWKGAGYLTSSLEKLKTHPDLTIPSIFFTVLYIIIILALLIVTGYALVTSVGLVNEWGLIRTMPSVGWPLFVFGLVFLGIFIISLIYLPFFFGVLIFGVELYMLEEADEGKDPNFLRCLNKIIKDFGLNTLIKLTTFSMFYNFATKFLGERLNRLVSQPFKAWVFIIFFSEKFSLKDSILLALKYFRASFTESFYGLEVLKYRDLIWSFGFVVAIISMLYAVVFLHLPLGEWYTTLVMITVLLGVMVVVGIIYGYVNAIIPLYYISMLKDVKKGTKIIETGRKISTIDKTPFIKYFIRLEEIKIDQKDIDHFINIVEKEVVNKVNF